MATQAKNIKTNNNEINPLCGLCNGNISNHLKKYNDFGINNYDGLFENLNLCFCEKCGLGFCLQIIDNDIVFNYYKYQYRAETSPYHINFEDLEDIHETFVDYSHKTTQQLVLIDDYCTFKRNEIFLDIGPGPGSSFYIASKFLKSPQLFGIEITKGASEFYNRFPLDKISILESLDAFISLNHKAKVILMSHCLEHYQLGDLPQLFEDIKQALEPNGLIIIEVPHVDLRVHANIRGVDTPHFLFFSQDSLSKLLIQYGFEILFQNTCADFYESEEVYNTKNNSVIMKLKGLLKRPLSKLPVSLQINIRKLFKFFQNIKLKPLHDSSHINLEVNSRLEEKDEYGGNREHLRLVARLAP